MTTVTEEINEEIARAGGGTRRALISMMASRDAVAALLGAENEKTVALLEVLEAIRSLCWKDVRQPSDETLCAIDKIACKALEVAGQ